MGKGYYIKKKWACMDIMSKGGNSLNGGGRCFKVGVSISPPSFKS